jgi:hypothetical protein
MGVGLKEIKEEGGGEKPVVGSNHQEEVSCLQLPTLLYIQTVQSLPLLPCMMVDLQSKTYNVDSLLPTKLGHGSVYLAQCEGVWYRVPVVTIPTINSVARVVRETFFNTCLARKVQLSIMRKGGWSKGA